MKPLKLSTAVEELLIENWDAHNNYELPDEQNSDYVHRRDSISTYLLGEIMPCSITIFGNNSTKKIIPKGTKITKSIIRAMAKYGYEIENCPIGKQIAQKINTVPKVAEGNDMDAEDVGLNASPSGRVWEENVADNGNILDHISIDDFRFFVQKSQNLIASWNNVVKYSKTNPEEAAQVVNHIYRLLTDIHLKSKETRDKIDPFLT